MSNGLIDEFINADEIARGLAPMHPESMALTASKLMINRLKELLEAKKNFAFETTGAGTNYVKHLKEAKKNGTECPFLASSRQMAEPSSLAAPVTSVHSVIQPVPSLQKHIQPLLRRLAYSPESKSKK